MCGFGYGKVLMWSRLLQSSVVCGFGYCKVFADVVSAAAKSLLCVVSAAVKFLLCEASGCRKFLLLCVVPAATKFCSVWFRLLQSSAVCVCVCVCVCAVCVAVVCCKVFLLSGDRIPQKISCCSGPAQSLPLDSTLNPTLFLI